MSGRLGSLLLEHSVLSGEQLERALREQERQGGRLGSLLIDLGLASEGQVGAALAEQHSLPFIDLGCFDVEDRVRRLIPFETAAQHGIVPLARLGHHLLVATSDPRNVLALDEIKFRTGLQVEPLVAPQLSIQRKIEECYGSPGTLALREACDRLLGSEELQLALSEPEERDVDLGELQKQSAEAPIIKLVDLILAEAIRRQASDVHIEPYEKQLRVRYRIDGMLYEAMEPPLGAREALVSRIKIMAGLDISQRRLPQDGRFRIRVGRARQRREIDLRVSSLPTLHGEKIVLRILDPAKLPLEMSRLGLGPPAMQTFREGLEAPYGMILVTGPTGSGKTSTLYTCLHELNRSDLNILTVEDPVEFRFQGVNQIQTNEEVGLTFAAALRAFLRQDPDVVLVGEIRDRETAEIAVHAALTGHRVLSTLHTNDAPSAILRLIHMGIEPFLVASSIQMICAQRLVRRICSRCRKRVPTPVNTLVRAGFTRQEAAHLPVYRGEGCSACHQSGYRGRTGVFEVLRLSPPIREIILAGGEVPEIRRLALEQGMRSLRQSGLEKIRSGITTVDEILRGTVAD